MANIKRKFNAMGSDNKIYTVYVYSSYQQISSFGDEYMKFVPDEIYKLSTGESISLWSGTLVIDKTDITLEEIK